MSNKYWPDQDYIEGPVLGLNSLGWMNAFPNFAPEEFADDNGHVLMLRLVIVRLQLMRVSVRAPLVVTSAYRNPEHNARVGGGATSMHLKGHAVDISLYNPRGKNHEGQSLEDLARRHGFNGIGRYAPNSNRSGFIHIDMRDTPAKWGDWQTTENKHD